MSTENKTLDELLSDPKQQVAARAAVRDALGEGAASLAYMKLFRKLPNFTTPRKVALISSFTVETAAPYLAVESYLSGWRADVSYHQYAMWRNVMIDPTLLGEDCEAAVLALDGTVADELGGDPTTITETVLSLIAAYRAGTAAPLVLLRIAPRPPVSGWGVGGEATTWEVAVVDAINHGYSLAAGNNSNVHVVDLAGALVLKGGAWHDAASFADNLSYFSARGIRTFAECVARAVGGVFVPRRKVLVTDLDHTLWHGIVGEDGVDGLAIAKGKGRPFTAYRDFLLQLRDSGILLAINSKNNEADAKEVFDQRGDELGIGWDDFSARRINWQDKATNLAEIALALNVGIDSLVFVDDNPMECSLVREMHPGVTVIQTPPGAVGVVDAILATRTFDTLVISEEDRNRADQYKAERDRNAARVDAGDINSFFASLGLSLSIERFGEGNSERIHQLLSKTNQFHLTLERPGIAALETRARACESVFGLRLKDKFGDYGLIGVLEISDTSNALEISNMAISCRALGRKVEESALAFAAERARDLDKAEIAATFVEGPRNQQVEAMLITHGFQFIDGDKERRYELQVSQAPAWPVVVERIGQKEEMIK